MDRTQESTHARHSELVAVGASSGGVDAVRRLVAGLGSDFPAAVLVVVHLDPIVPSRLAEVVQPHAALPVEPARDGEMIVGGRVYVASPDRHLVVEDGRLRLTRGPRENRNRPSVDVLFRSVAVARGSSALGVVLTGQLDDGTSGLSAIQRCGGRTIVQDPEDAAFDEMPRSAIEHVPVQHVAPLEKIPEVLRALVQEQLVASGAPAASPPHDLVREVRISLDGTSDIETAEALGEPSPFSCPECGGPMWALEGESLARFRCHTGHAYTCRSLAGHLSQRAEQSMWVALRTIEERVRMLRRLAADEAARGRAANSSRYLERAADAQEHVAVLRDLLLSVESRA